MPVRRHLGILAVAAALATLTAVPAHADNAVLTTGGAGGSAVAVGDTLTAGLLPGTVATLYSSADGTDGITCSSSSFQATVTANPAAPGTATESLTSQSFDSCTSNVFGVTNVESVTVDNLPYVNAVSDAAGSPVTLSAGGAPIQTTLVLDTLIGTITCVYQASGSLAGSASNDNRSLSFGNQAFSLSSGPSSCSAQGYFTAAYGPVTDSSAAGGPQVYVN